MIGCRVAIQTFDSFYNKKAVHLILEVSSTSFKSSGSKPGGVLKQERSVPFVWTRRAMKSQADAEGSVTPRWGWHSRNARWTGLGWG